MRSGGTSTTSRRNSGRSKDASKTCELAETTLHKERGAGHSQATVKQKYNTEHNTSQHNTTQTSRRISGMRTSVSSCRVLSSRSSCEWRCAAGACVTKCRGPWR
ncbi:hypothetical protein M758_3G170900 [Ceratodon purpureus]|nr:hypothetical protein M758_3G170900 [Ceratodon purpureus]